MLMDVQLGRWHVVDAIAEKYLSTSPYAYVENNPINRVDVMGLWDDDDYGDDGYGDYRDVNDQGMPDRSGVCPRSYAENYGTDEEYDEEFRQAWEDFEDDVEQWKIEQAEQDYEDKLDEARPGEEKAVGKLLGLTQDGRYSGLEHDPVGGSLYQLYQIYLKMKANGLVSLSPIGGARDLALALIESNGNLNKFKEPDAIILSGEGNFYAPGGGTYARGYVYFINGENAGLE